MRRQGKRVWGATGPTLRAFGSLEIQADGAVLGPKSLGGIKPRQVLEILVSARGHPVAKERLIELLWPDRPPRNPSGSLESHVSVLRAHLPPGPARDALTTEAGAYRLATGEGGLELDLDRFDALVTEAERASTAAARDLLESALELVRGEVFEDEPRASWALRLRERYRERVVTARLDAAEAALAERDFAGALDHAELVRAGAPLDERAARAAMVAHYGLGRQDAALAVYDRLRAGLADGVGLDPLPETRMLQLAILRHSDVGSLIPGDIPRTEPGFRRLVERQSAGLWWTTDADLRVTSVAGTALEALHATPEDFLGRTIPEIFPDQGPEVPQLVASRAALLGEASTFDAKWRNLLLQAHVEPVRDGRGRVVGVTGVAIDITDRMLGEEALAEVQRRLEAQYDGIPMPTYTWRREAGDFVLVEANEAGTKASNGRIDDYLGRRASDIYRSEPDIVADLQRAFTQRGSFTREMTYRIPHTGSDRDLRVTYVFVPPESVVVHLEDLTDRRRTEEALRSSQSALESILEHSADAIVVIDPEADVVLEANGRAADLVGYSREELAGMPVSRLHPEEMPDLDAFLATVEADGHAWTDRLTTTAKSGRLIQVEAAASATVFGGRPAVINLIRPLREGRHADPSLYPRLEDRSSA